MKYTLTFIIIFFTYCCRCQVFTTIKYSIPVYAIPLVANDTLVTTDDKPRNAFQELPSKNSLTAAKSSFSMPLKKMRITSNYGNRFHPIHQKVMLHNGIDLAAGEDTVMSIMAGLVTRIAYSPTLGLFIEIQHENSFTSLYGHLSYILVQVGDWIKGGDNIAITGSSGVSTGEHLHLIIKYQRVTINPNPILKIIAEKMHEVSKKVNPAYGYSYEYLQAARQLKQLTIIKEIAKVSTK